MGRTYLEIKKCDVDVSFTMTIRLSDVQWERIREHFSEENIPDGRCE